MGALLVWFLALGALVSALPPPLDPIDTCIMACDRCYKGGARLLDCANDCIMMAGQMGLKWSVSCPFLSLPLYGP